MTGEQSRGGGEKPPDEEKRPSLIQGKFSAWKISKKKETSFLEKKMPIFGCAKNRVHGFGGEKKSSSFFFSPARCHPSVFTTKENSGEGTSKKSFFAKQAWNRLAFGKKKKRCASAGGDPVQVLGQTNPKKTSLGGESGPKEFLL